MAIEQKDSLNSFQDYQNGIVKTKSLLVTKTIDLDGVQGVTNNIDIVNESVNLLDKDTMLKDTGIFLVDGSLNSRPGYQTSQLIPITELKRYRRTVSGNRAYYDQSEVFISGATTGTDFQAPLTAAYIRITVADANVDAEMLVNAYDNLTPYQSYSVKKIDKLSLSEQSNLGILSTNKNIINYNDLEYNVRYSTVDGSKTTGDFAWTGKIPCKPESFISFTKGDNLGTNWVFWDENDVFLQGNVSEKAPKAPVNVAYFRARIVNNTDLLNAVFCYGTNRLSEFLDPREVKTNKKSTFGFLGSKWFKKHWWVMGDSISTGDGRSGTYAIKPYHYLLSEEKDIVVNSVAVGGRTLTGTNADDVAQQINNGTMPTTENAPDVITIFAGTNDFGYNTVLATFTANLDTLINDIQTRFPKTSIGFITPMKRSTDNDNAVGQKLGDYVNVIKTKAQENSIPVLDLFTESGINLSNATVNAALSVGGDGLHPNDDGHKILVGKIGSFLESL